MEAKLARYIFGECDRGGSPVKPAPFVVLSMSKKDLAAQLGIAVETLSSTLRKLKEKKIIRESAGKKFILDMKRLRELGG